MRTNTDNEWAQTPQGEVESETISAVGYKVGATVDPSVNILVDKYNTQYPNWATFQAYQGDKVTPLQEAGNMFSEQKLINKIEEEKRKRLEAEKKAKELSDALKAEKNKADDLEILAKANADRAENLERKLTEAEKTAVIENAELKAKVEVLAEDAVKAKRKTPAKKDKPTTVLNFESATSEPLPEPEKKEGPEAVTDEHIEVLFNSL